MQNIRKAFQTLETLDAKIQFLEEMAMKGQVDTETRDMMHESIEREFDVELRVNEPDGHEPCRVGESMREKQGVIEGDYARFYEQQTEYFQDQDFLRKAVEKCEQLGRAGIALKIAKKLDDKELLERLSKKAEAQSAAFRAKAEREYARRNATADAYSEILRRDNKAYNMCQQAEKLEKAGDYITAATQYAEAFKVAISGDYIKEKIIDSAKMAAKKLIEEKKSTEAAEVLEQFKIYGEAGELYEIIGNMQKAVECFEMSGERCERAGDIMTSLGNPEEAARLYQKGADQMGGLPIDQARILRKIGKHKEAAENLAKRGFHKRAAAIFEEIGMMQEAGDCYEHFDAVRAAEIKVVLLE